MVEVAVRQVMVLDPTGVVRTVVEGQAPRLQDLRGKVVGLLDNGMPQSGVFLDRMGELLSERYQVSGIIKRTKPSMSSPAPEPMLAELIAGADFLIAGVGI